MTIWFGLTVPEEYGGAGLGLVELCLVLEELGRAAYPGPYFSSVVLGGLGLALAGSTAQKERWLSAVASGQARLSAALVEESLDWDPAMTTTTATRSADGWTLSGAKRFVPWAHVADAVLVVKARVDHKEGESKLIALEVNEFEVYVAPTEVRLRVDARKAPAGALRELGHVVRDYPGEAKVVLALETSEGPKTLEFGPEYRVQPVPDFFAEVKALLGEAAVL